MSRAGKYPVVLKDGVSAAIAGDTLTVKGPKGEIKIPLNTKNAGLVDIEIKDGKVISTPKNDEDKASRAMWGTMTRNIRCAVEGVTDGFSKSMYMNGVGYKAIVKGNQLVLNVGFSHDVIMDIPAGLSVEVTEPTKFTIKGIDKCALGLFADKIHKIRKADPYKGKGIFYVGEHINRKEGKKK